MRLSKLTLSFGLFIVLSASFTQQILYYFFKIFGKRETITALGIIFILVGIGSVIYIIKRPLPRLRKLFFFLLFSLGLILSWRLPIAAERIHLLEYGLLGGLATRDTTKKRLSLLSVFLSLAVILCFGLLDEGFQLFLPQRVAELRDVCLNFIGGGWGIALFLLSKV